MNYYPNQNYYNPYQYGSNMNNQYTAVSQTQPIPVQQIQVPSLNGKVVDSIDVAKATEVPIGGYGVFPKADLSEIYIKSWNNNGTTSLSVYKIAEGQSEGSDIGFPQLIEKINLLDTKLDDLISSTVNSNNNIITKKAEVKLNEY